MKRMDTDGSAVNDGFEIPMGAMEDKKVLKEKKPGGTKRKEVQADVRKEGKNDMTDTVKPTKRAKKMVGESCPFINPFKATLSIPEPTLSVAEYEAHSWLLSQSCIVNKSDDVASRGQSTFTKSLLVIPSGKITSDPIPPLEVPVSVPIAERFPVKQSSHAIKPKPKSTPTHNALTLAPLPFPNTKTTNTKPVRSETSIIQPVPHPFLALPPPFSAASSSTASSCFCSETPAPSDSSATAVSNQSHHPSIKIPKHVADKLLSLKAHQGRLEDEAKIAKAFETNMKKSHKKILADNKELMKQNEQLDSEVSELREEVHQQMETLLIIHDMIRDLKASDRLGDVVKAVTKVEKTARDNAWNVSWTCSRFVLL